MELIEILNEDGSGTGVYKDRDAVHRDGDLHGSALVWIVREVAEGGSFQVLLQKRSSLKDSFPGCLDTSCAGHIEAGATFLTSAIRELEEELGITATEEDLRFLFDHAISWEAVFRGRKFVNHEINRVYLLRPKIPVDLDGFQPSEIDALCWEDPQVVLSALQAGDPDYCIQLSIFEKLLNTLIGNQ